MRRPHLLYVAWGFPPCRSGGVYRALATVGAFVDSGWDVTVITADRESFERFTGVDPSLEELIPDRVTVERVPFSWPVHETDLRRWPWLRAHHPQAWRRLRNRLDRIPFPEVGYGPWRGPIERAAVAVHERHPVDLCVATANPNVDFAPALMLNRRFGVPYVMDYRDAWLLDVFSGEQLFDSGSRVGRWERRLIAAAQEIWYVNQPIAEWHRRLYPQAADRIKVVANGYDPGFAPTPRRSTSSTGAGLVFGYIGTVSGKVPLEEFLNGWKLARSRDPLMRDARAEIHGYLGYYATKDPRTVAMLTQFAEQGVTYEGPVPKAEIAATYERFDALLLILGTGRYVTSGKAYEYIAAGLPVAAVHDPGNAATDVFRGHPRWFGVSDLSAESIAQALQQAARNAVEAGVDDLAATAAFAARYDRRTQLQPRIDALARLVFGTTATSTPTPTTPPAPSTPQAPARVPLGDR